MFVIKRRSTGKIAVRDTGGKPVFFPNREEAKPTRDRMNNDHYGKKPVPLNNREYYVARSNRHRL